MRLQRYRYIGAVEFHLNYPWTEYGLLQDLVRATGQGTKMHFESRLHVDLTMFTNHTWHGVPCRSVSVSHLLCLRVAWCIILTPNSLLFAQDWFDGKLLNSQLLLWISFPKFVKVVERAKVVCYRFERAPNAVALYLPGNFLALRVVM